MSREYFKEIIIISGYFLMPVLLIGQISGTVSNPEGEPLAYATISFENSSKGTSTNLSGQYQLSISPGLYTLKYQYLGYETVTYKINYTGQPEVIDIVLNEESFQLSEITITADGEDPAYAVMRKVIAEREKNKKAINNYIGDIYIKGMIKTYDAPESFLGQEIGDMEGILDSNRQGILYLSESRSTIYFQQPEKFKEVMLFSKTAGNDNGFTFNQYSGANFNFYYENINFDRTMISPLNDAAFSHYRFKLEGVQLDETGQLINKISVIPKDDVRPLFHGTIYIVEDEWVLSRLDLSFTGKAIKNRFFNEIRIRQIMQYSSTEKQWYTQNQIIDFDSDFLGFKFGGTFSYFFFDININTEFSDEIFGAELFSMKEDAMDKPISFWDSIRPIPLTLEENKDYTRKDSLKTLRESKEYLDSVDRQNNNIGIGSLIFGFNNNNTYNKRYFRLGSPLGQTRFNPVEGWAIGTKITIRKYSQDDNRRFQAQAGIRYGFSDKTWKGNIEGSFRYSRKNLSFINFGIGREYFQFDERNPLSFGLGTWSSLFYKRNHIKMFDKTYWRIGLQSEIINSLYGWISFAGEKRSPLFNNSDYSLFNKDRDYEKNNPFDEGETPAGFTEHNAYLLKVDLRWRPGQKYFSYPRFKMRILSEWPTVSLQYHKAIPIGNNTINYDRLIWRVRDTYINTKTYGFSSINFEGGMFLSKERLGFVDYFHFLGNETTATYFYRYPYSFKNMPFYDFSTTEDFIQVNIEHHFDGYIMDKVPLLADSGLTFVLGFGGVWNKERDYYEWSIGLEGFSIGAIDFMRIDYVQSYTDTGFYDRGLKFGFTRFFNQVVN